MDQIGNEGEQDAESLPRHTMMNKCCPNCGGELEIGGLYSPGRGISRVYFSFEDGPSDESFHLPVLAAVCQACGQISLMADRRDFGQEG